MAFCRVEWSSRANQLFDARDDFGDRVVKLQGPLRWNDALRRSQEQRVVQNKAQPAKRVADSGRRQVQSRGRALKS